MKYVIFIIDGAADYPIVELNGKTPLMAASKPNIDNLAKNGKCGLFRTIPLNFSTGSAVANLSILGYDPLSQFQGRGVLEAAAMGINLEKNDVAFRCNTICVKDNKIKNHSGGHISSKEGAELIRAVDSSLGKEDIKFYPGVSYRHLLVFKGSYSADLDCAPPHDHVDEPIAKLLSKSNSADGEKTAATVNKLMLDSKPLLEKHPVNVKRVKGGKDQANMIWPWSPGKKPEMKTFQELYGLKGAVITAVDLVRGLGIYAGFDVINVEGATGLYDTNYEGKADACIEALKDHDIVYVHVEAPDEAGHEGDLKLKIKCIEDFDKRLLGRVLENLEEEVRIAVLPDHPTPVKIRGHVSDPIPFAIYDKSVKGDMVESFDEFSCKKGSFGLLEKDEFIRALLGLK
ncbi:MAG: cofactor-independent phosphoglycerate mutase [Nanoarchaeota archaeon]